MNRNICGAVLLAGLLSLSPGFTAARAAEARVTGKPQLEDAWGAMPLRFEANWGQTDPAVKFLARDRGYTLFLTATEAVLSLPASAPDDMGLPAPAAVLRLKLVGANPVPRISGLEELPGRVNYYRGPEPWKRATGIHTFAGVKYEGVYPGIDAVYYGNQRVLEHDYVIAPGARPETIRLAFDGADRIETDAGGNLILRLPGREVQLSKPTVYQEIAGQRRPVDGRYVLCGGNEVGFDVAAYDRTRPLVIDPTVVYSTYLGGSGGEDGVLVPDLDPSGGVFVVGTTGSLDFPIEPPTVQSNYCGGGNDLFVAKISAAGALEFSTYLGGNGEESYSVVATNGNLYIYGTTSSTNFPTFHAYQSVYGGGLNDAFLLKLSPSGSLVFSTYLGGIGQENATLDFDGAGNAYLSGQTTSANFPTHSGAQNSYGGGDHDYYVAKFDPNGAVQYVTCLGGSGDEDGSVMVDGPGNVVAVGTTSSANFPLAHPIRAAYGGGAHDLFVARIAPAGNLTFSTYLGGNGDEQPGGAAVDADGNIYVTGRTWSGNFPVLNAAQSTFGGGSSPFPLPAPADEFVTKFSSSGALLYSTYLGGSGDESASMGVDASGNVLLVGSTASSNFPTRAAAQSVYGGSSSPYATVGDVFVTRLDSSGQFVFSTYLGGSSLELASSGPQWDSAGNVYVIGMTSSTNFPVLNAAQPVYGGGSGGGGGGWTYVGDLFVTKYSPTGTRLYSTYFGGWGDETGTGSVDPDGQVLLWGQTNSSNFPGHNAAQIKFGGGTHDLFVARLNANGQMVFATCIGGNGDESGSAFAAPDGGFYVAGITSSSSFPMVNATQTKPGGGNDIFLVKLTATGSFVYSTCIGGSGDEPALSTSGWVAVPDGSGHVYVLSTTSSLDFPVHNALQPAYGGNGDVFLVKLDDGSSPACTYTLSATSTNFAIGAATGSFGVAASSGCDWSATADAAWLHTASTGTGNGAVSFTMDENPGFGSRTGHIRVQTQTFTVTQLGVGSTLAQATFTGLFVTINPTNTVGVASVAVTTNGAFTAQFLIGTKKYTVKGQFDHDGQWSGTLGPVTVRFQLDPVNQRIVGTTSGAFVAGILAQPCYDQSHPPPVALVGAYNVVLPANTNAVYAAAPPGAGCGVVKISADGRISFSATLANGTKIKQTASLRQDHTWPLYVPLKNGGALDGVVTFASVPGMGDLAGDVNWYQPAATTGRYRSGFRTVLPLVGARYTVPAAGQRALNLRDATGNAMVILDFGDLPSRLAIAVTVAANNTVTPVSVDANQLTLKINTKTGQLSGTFVHPATGKRVKFAGAILQSQDLGAGFFLDPDASGVFSLEPAP